MMAEKKLPFSEVSFQVREADVVIQAPWVYLEADIDSNIKELKAAIESVDHDNKCFQTFLDELDEFYVSYPAPRLNLLKPENQGNLLSKESVEALRGSVAYPGLYDPVSLFYLLEKESLKHQSFLEQEFNVYKQLEELLEIDVEAFKEALELVLNQTYYITSNFSKVVCPDQSVCMGLQDFVSDIYAEEVGHDKLILNSLSHLGKTPDVSLVFEETKSLIDLLQESTQHSAMGFAIINSYLEGNHYPESDPFADVIKKSPFKEAAKGLDAHFKINKDSNHKDIGLEIVSSFDTYVSYKEALEVKDIHRKLMGLIQQIDQKILFYIDSKKGENNA